MNIIYIYIYMITHVLSCFSCVWLFVTPWTIAHYAPLSMGFSRQKYWSGLPFPSPGDLSKSGIQVNLHLLCILHWQVSSLQLGPPGKPIYIFNIYICISVLFMYIIFVIIICNYIILYLYIIHICVFNIYIYVLLCTIYMHMYICTFQIIFIFPYELL